MENFKKSKSLENKSELVRAKEKAKIIDNLPIQILEGRSISLLEISSDYDIEDFYNLVNSNEDFSHFVSRGFKNNQDFESFKEEIAKWFNSRTNFIFLCKRKTENLASFGVVILYDLNTLKDEVSLSVFLEEEKRNSQIFSQIFLLISDFIFNKLDIESAKFEIYSDNEYMLNMVRKREEFGVKEEESSRKDLKKFTLSKNEGKHLLFKFKDLYL